VGNSVYETEGLQQMFGVKKGDIYDKKTMHKQLGIGKETDPEATSVSSLYQNEGYLMSQIEPAETIIAPDSIDIEVKVFEGKQFTINEVGITGNQRARRRGDPPRAGHPSGRTLQPRAADAHHPPAGFDGTLQPRGHHARHQARFERAGQHQLAA